MARDWGAVGIVARARLRRGMGAVLALAAVVGITGGAAIAALAGARSTDSAYRRLLRATDTVDVGVGLADSPPGPAFGRRVLALPQVEQGDGLVGFASLRRSPDGTLQRAFGPSLVGAERGGLFDRFGRLKLEAGRLPRAGAIHEAVADQTAARQFDLEIGSRMSLFLLDFRRFGELSIRTSAEDREPSNEEVAPLLQPIELRIVGIGRSPEQIVSASSGTSEPGLIVSPTFVDRHRAVAAFTRAYVLLRDPERDLPAFSAALQRTFPDAGASLTTASTNEELFDRSVAPYVRALQLFAIVVFAAGILVLGQAAARLAASDSADAGLLRGLGLSPAGTAVAGAVRGIAAAILGALLAIAVAVAASPIFPLGLGGVAEPDAGVTFDWLILGVGATAVAAVVAARSLVTAWARVRAAQRADHGTGVSPSRAGSTLASAGAAPSVVLGVGWALRSDRRGQSAPLWSVLPGLAAAVLALVAALSFGASLDHLVSSPKLYGWDWDLSFDGFDIVDAPSREQLSADPDLVAVASGARGAAAIGGRLVPALGVSPDGGSVAVRVTKGRPPAAPDEVALGARDLDELDRSVGDTIVARTSDGRRRLRYRIVGRTVVPALSLSENVGLADGATFTLRGLRRLDPGAATSFFLVDVRPGAAAVVRERYGSQFEVLGPQRPREILSFDSVRSTPIILAALLALMGAAALAHALVVAVRQGRREIAVLKTLGFTRHQVMAMIASHATTLVVLALVIGLPLGLAAGRWSWDLLASPLGLDAPAVVPVAVVFGVAATMLLFANLVASVPGRQASRTEPAIVLRSE